MLKRLGWDDPNVPIDPVLDVDNLSHEEFSRLPVDQRIRLLYRKLFRFVWNVELQCPSLIADRGINDEITLPFALYLGDFRDATNAKRLTELGITHFLTMLGSPAKTDLKHLGTTLRYMNIPADDVPNYQISKHFEETFDFIDSAKSHDKGAVFVHCAAGVSRSATVVIIYLMRSQNWTALRAFRFVSSRRPVICPNQGFMKQIFDFEAKLIEAGAQLQ